MGRKSVGTQNSRRKQFKNYDIQNRKQKRSQRNIDSFDKHSLGHDVTIVRIKKGERIGAPKIFDKGSMAIIDADTNLLVVCFRYVDITEPGEHISTQYNHAISTYYQHGLARQPVLINSSHNMMGEHKSGEMYPTGHRAGSDLGMKAGPYALSKKTSKSLELMLKDAERMNLLPDIEKFLAQRFQSLAGAVFTANTSVGATNYAPSFASAMFWDHPNDICFGSNLVITRYGFSNVSHRHFDATPYAFGFFAIIDQYTGELYHFPTSGPSPKIRNAAMLFEEYNFGISLANENQVLEMTWKTRELHNSRPSITEDEAGNEIAPKDSPITAFGSSIQIANSLVARVSHFFEIQR